VRAEEKYDGIRLLRTSTDLPMREVTLLDARLIFHKYDETTRGHVFCSLLVLPMQKELFLRMAKAGIKAK